MDVFNKIEINPKDGEKENSVTYNLKSVKLVSDSESFEISFNY